MNAYTVSRTQRTLLALLLFSTLAAAQPRRKVIFNQDCSGPGGSNMQTLLVLLQSPEVEVLGIKNKKLADLNDEFAKDVSDAQTLDELKTKVREGLEHQRDHKHQDLLREKVLGELVKLHDFPVPDSLVQHQMDVRLERVVRSLAQQGVDPRAVNLDWVALRARQQDKAKDDVKAELIIDRVATAENIDVTDEEIEHELEHLASHSGESAEAIRARLTKQGALDRMKAKLRSDKTLDWIGQNANVKTVAVAASAATDAK